MLSVLFLGRRGGSRLTACALTSVFSWSDRDFWCPAPDVQFSHPAVTRRSTTRHPCHLLLSGSGKHREVACSAERLHSASLRTRVLSGGGLSLSGVGEFRQQSVAQIASFGLNCFRFIPTSAVTFASFAVIASRASLEIVQTAFHTDYRSHFICYDLAFFVYLFVSFHPVRT